MEWRQTESDCEDKAPTLAPLKTRLILAMEQARLAFSFYMVLMTDMIQLYSNT